MLRRVLPLPPVGVRGSGPTIDIWQYAIVFPLIYQANHAQPLSQNKYNIV